MRGDAFRPEHRWKVSLTDARRCFSRQPKQFPFSVCEWRPGFEDGKRQKSAQFGVSAQSAMFDLVEKSINLVL